MRKQEAGGEGKVLAVNEVTGMQKGLGSCGDKLEGGVEEGAEKGGIWAGVRREVGGLESKGSFKSPS